MNRHNHKQCDIERTMRVYECIVPNTKYFWIQHSFVTNLNHNLHFNRYGEKEEEEKKEKGRNKQTYTITHIHTDFLRFQQ